MKKNWQKSSSIIIVCCLSCVLSHPMTAVSASRAGAGCAGVGWGLSTSGCDQWRSGSSQCGRVVTRGHKIESSILRGSVSSLCLSLWSTLASDIMPIRPGDSWGHHWCQRVTQASLSTPRSANLDQCCTPAPAVVMTNSGGCCMIPSWSLVPGLS